MRDLSRFHRMHEIHYERALAEIRASRKVSHWMWYIFPQIRGLGRSATSDHYGIADLEEARAYARDPVLGAHLAQISRAMLEQPLINANVVLGGTDAMKLRSCMTLFEIADPEENVYGQVLDRFYGGSRDQRTLSLLKKTE